MPVYSAESQVSDLPSVFRAMLTGLRTSRYTAFRMFRRDVKAEYAKSKFGLIWDFVDPLVFASIFYFLEKVGMLRPGQMAIPYVVFIVYGFLLFNTFQEAVLMPMELIRRQQGLLLQLKLAPECLLLAVIYRILFNSMFRFAILIVFSVALGAFSPVGFLKFTLGFPLLILAGMSIGTLLAPFHTTYNDIGRITRILLTPLRFGSPVMYAIPSAILMKLSPISVILDNLRWLATTNTLRNVHTFEAWIVFDALVFLVAWTIFHVSIPVLAERA